MRECAELAHKLHQADLALLRLTHEEDETGVDHSKETDRILEEAAAALNAFPKAGLELHYNDELPLDPLDDTPIGDRLRVVWKGSKWNEDNPLYLALPEEALCAA